MKKLLISDLDETLQKAHSEINSKQINLLLSSIKNGLFIVIITGASTNSLYKRVINRIPNEFLNKFIFYTNSGALSFQISTEGKYKKHYSLESDFLIHKRFIKKLTQDVATELNIEIIKEGKATKAKYNEIWIEYKEAQAALTMQGNENKREKVVSALMKRFKKYNLKLEAHVAGSRTVDIHLKDINKSYAVNHLTKLLSNIGYSNETKVFIAGDSFSRLGSDRLLLHPNFNNPTILHTGSGILKIKGYKRIEQLNDENYLKIYYYLNTI